MILGIDEVGRGPWAGPLVVGAVVLGEAQIEGLTDSKKLTKKRREELAPQILKQAAGYGLGWVSAHELDEVGMSEALKLATRRAVEQVHTYYDEIIIDGTVNFLRGTTKEPYVTTMKKADLLIQAVSAASIIAKVARDNYMAEQAVAYPGYGFERHVGYGTAAHIAAIEKLGVTPLHRLSFAPLAAYRKSELAPKKAESTAIAALTGKQIGDKGEEAVATYLKKRGHEIVDRNWKTKYCEIDIVSRFNDTIYFTEVKYRRQANQGGGLAAITSKKLHHMTLAARLYIQSHRLQSTDVCLAAAAVNGQPAQVETWLAI